MTYVCRLMFLIVFAACVIEATLDMGPGRGVCVLLAIVSGLIIVAMDSVVRELS